MKISKYKKDFPYSYALGAQPSIDLLTAMPEQVKEVYIHSSFTGRKTVEELCHNAGVPVYNDDRVFERAAGKENCYVMAVFDKFECDLSVNKPHVLLVNPSDMGNLGTIARTLAGFGIYDLAIITPCADIFNPKTVRASMGALFKLRHRFFASAEEYITIFPKYRLFPFMLNGETILGQDEIKIPEHFTLVFGNEASGLDDGWHKLGQSVFIPQTGEVESLNLALSVGIGTFIFMNGQGNIQR